VRDSFLAGWASRLSLCTLLAWGQAAAVSTTVGFAAVAQATSPSALRVIALSGETLSTNGRVIVAQQFVESPIINNDGHVAFLAQSAAAASVWLASPAGLRLVAASGEPAPATSVTFESFSDLVLPDGAGPAFKATLVGPSVRADSRDSIWLDRTGGLQLAARAGDAAPAADADLRFTHFETPVAANGDGRVAFFARVHDKEQQGTADGSGLWTAGPGGVASIARADALAIPDDAAITFLPQSFEAPFAHDPVISPAGQTIFRGFLGGAGVDDSNLNGLWSDSPAAGLRLLVRGGDAAVGVEGKSFVSFPAVPTINAAGDSALLAFYGTPQGHGHGGNASSAAAATIDGPLGLGIWLCRASGALEPMFRVGDDAPGVPGGAQFVDVFNPIMNAASRVALLAVVDGPEVNDANQLGVWSNAHSTNGEFALIARQGDQAPGCDPGFVFGAFLTPALNAAGQTAFMANGYRVENGVILDSGLGIWGEDCAGALALVARVGQTIEVAAGDVREIASLALTTGSGGEDGRPRGLNDRGEITFRAVFADGSSGIFVSAALTVPEPPARFALRPALLYVGFATRWRTTRHTARFEAPRNRTT
jgi:hypothetical protein